MPIDLTKIINDPSTQKPKFTPSYFQTRLTGSGGAVGLFNKNTNVVNKNIATNLSKNHKIALNPGKHVRALLYHSFIGYEQNDTYHTMKISRQVSNHQYELSAYNLIKFINEHFQGNLSTQLSNADIPHFFKDLEFTNIDQNQNYQLEIGINFDSLDYTHFESDPKKSASNVSTIIEPFVLNPNLVLKISNNTSQTNQINFIDDLNDFLNTPNGNLNLNVTNYLILNNLDIYDLLTNGNQFNYDALFNRINQTFKFKQHFDVKAFLDYLDTIDTEKIIGHQAKINHDFLLADLAHLFKMYQNQPNQMEAQQQLLIQSYHLLKLEEENYNDTDYQKLYDDIKNITLNNPNAKYRYNNYQFSKLLANNTRLSLTHEITKLGQNKNVYQFKPTKPFKTNDKYSKEQLAAIKTTAPYTTVSAGAGSGKSHTLVGRLTYLTENGIQSNQILASSFNRTSSENLIKRFGKDLNSMTNANLFNKIYQNNFPDHELTASQTIANTLKMIRSNAPLLTKTQTMATTKLQLTRILSDLQQHGYKKVDLKNLNEQLVTLVNDRLDDTLTLLNSIKQTCLELQPVIINALMLNNRNISYPANVQNLKFIITDESQDSSTFEYVLLLQLAEQNNAQIMLMGDANQSIYEFRDANPEFLNALERSNVFKTYKMETNYRSNQSILNVANEFLSVLKTNSHTNLQLKANQFSNLDPNVFKDHIKLGNVLIQPKSSRSSDIKTQLIQNLTNRQDFSEWVVDQYKNKHQIAIMAFRNNDTQAIGEAVAEILKRDLNVDPTVGYTHKPQPKTNLWLSNMLSGTKDDDFEQDTRKNGANPRKLIASLKDRLQLVADNTRYANGIINPFAEGAVNMLLQDNLVRSTIKEYNHHQTSYGHMKNVIVTNLIKAENHHNNMTRLIDNSTQNTDWQDCDIVVSTIHSAKGLEFDSVVCYYDESMRSATAQSTLRLYGVALTRAKNNEFILNRPKLKRSKGMVVPTNFGYKDSDMFKTPMRTAYYRVIQKLTQNATPIND